MIARLLTEGDRKAYYESAEQTMKQNRQKIVRLQQDNKDLYKLKADKLKVSCTGSKLLYITRLLKVCISCAYLVYVYLSRCIQ